GCGAFLAGVGRGPNSVGTGLAPVRSPIAIARALGQGPAPKARPYADELREVPGDRKGQYRSNNELAPEEKSSPQDRRKATSPPPPLPRSLPMAPPCNGGRRGLVGIGGAERGVGGSCYAAPIQPAHRHLLFERY